LPLAIYAATAASLTIWDWNHGIARSVTVVLGTALFALAVRRPLDRDASRRGWQWLILGAALLQLAVRAAMLLSAPANPEPTPIGKTTLVALKVLASGGSLYASTIDPQPWLPTRGLGLEFFSGYKYGPLVLRYFQPFIVACEGPKGLYVGNAVLLAVLAILCFVLVRRLDRSTLTAVCAAATLLLPPYLYRELFVQGINDPLPLTLALAALVAIRAEAPAVSGLLLGLSMVCKSLPGLFIVPLLLGHPRRGRILVGIALGLSWFLPYLWATPRELVANLVIFNLKRPPDCTSLLFFLPDGLRVPVGALGPIGILAVVWRYHQGERTVPRILGATALMITLFLATGKVIHQNYCVWLAPFAGIALARFYRPEERDADYIPER
jgi:hypothetical protein